MAKEYMFYIRNAGDAKAALSAEDHLAFIKKCEVYIGRLKKEGKLIAAQPLLREGVIVSKTKNSWNLHPVDPNKEVQVGYYHISAQNMAEATELAKENPEFDYVPSASIEIRPVKTKEDQTKFVYPK
jgi:hypothetical protein